MKVNINEIEKIITFLLSKLRESKGEEIDVDNDFYWDISSDQIYNPYEDPTILTLGQLSDDLQELQRFTLFEDAIGYDLKRVSEILKALYYTNETAF